MRLLVFGDDLRYRSSNSNSYLSSGYDEERSKRTESIRRTTYTGSSPGRSYTQSETRIYPGLSLSSPIIERQGTRFLFQSSDIYGSRDRSSSLGSSGGYSRPRSGSFSGSSSYSSKTTTGRRGSGGSSSMLGLSRSVNLGSSSSGASYLRSYAIGTHGAPSGYLTGTHIHRTSSITGDNRGLFRTGASSSSSYLSESSLNRRRRSLSPLPRSSSSLLTQYGSSTSTSPRLSSRFSGSWCSSLTWEDFAALADERCKVSGHVIDQQKSQNYFLKAVKFYFNQIN